MIEGLSYQEAAAMQQARAFLIRLGDHRQIRRIPREVRAEARALVRGLPPVERLRHITPHPLKSQEISRCLTI